MNRKVGLGLLVSTLLFLALAVELSLGEEGKQMSARMLSPCEADLSKLVQRVDKFIRSLPSPYNKEREQLLKGYERYEDPDARVVHSVETKFAPPKSTKEKLKTVKGVRDHLKQIKERQAYRGKK